MAPKGAAVEEQSTQASGVEGAGAALTLALEATRKALHLVTAVVPVLYSRGLPRRTVLIFLVVAASLALLVEASRRLFAPCHMMFERAVGRLLRERERTAITGATWLLVACLATVVLLPRDAAVATLWCATVGDPAATLVGRAYDALRGHGVARGKTTAGSVVCFSVSVAGAWVLARFQLPAAIAIAFAATIVERASLPLDDNVRVAAAAGVTAWLLS